VLEAAVDLARVAERSGAGSAPPALKTFLRFTSFPPKALASVKKVLERDDDLRAQVAALVSDDEVAPAAREWLERTDGWRDRFESLVEERRASEREAEISQTAKKAGRRLAAAEAARDRVQAELAEARADLEESGDELTAERARRRASETKAEEAAAEIADLEARLARAMQDLEGARNLAERRLADQRALEAEVTRLTAELAETAVSAVVEIEVEEPPPTGEAGNWPERGLIAGSVREATAGAQRLAAALEDLARLMAPPPVPEAQESVAVAPTTRRRRPMSVPSGLFADSDAAVAHFLAVPHVLVMVDGYNVAMLGWPECDLETRRDRLIGGLETLAARTGAAFDVVFDGADVGVVATVGRSMGVNVRFTSEDVEADDVIIADAATVPVDRPLVVVSNDHRVRDGVAAVGATVVSSDRLLSALGRQAG
jgi:predicted RNA-binding protein with PIN domain